MLTRGVKRVVPRLRRLKGLVALHAVYRGQAVVCPCCDHGYRRFIRHRERERAACPGCGALERHRLLFLFLQDELGLFDSRGRLLHFAPERCLEERLRRIEGLEYVSVDLDPGRAMVRADIANLPFEDEAFDFIICSHVLEHVEDDRSAIAGLYRILDPGGWAIVIVPIRRAQTYEAPHITDPTERLRHFGQADHVREIGADYYLRLADAGFSVERRTYALELSPEARERFGLRANELYVCTKEPALGAKI